MHTNFLESTCVCDVTVLLLRHSDERLRCIVKHMSIQARALLRGSAPAPGQIAPGRGKHFAPGHFVAPGQIACRGSPAPAPQHWTKQENFKFKVPVRESSCFTEKLHQMFSLAADLKPIV